MPRRSNNSNKSSKRKKNKKNVKELKMLEREAKEINVLKRRVKDEAPDVGDTEQEKTKFSEMPLCQYTQQALKSGKFVQMTKIQKAAIPHALADRDVLGAAKTGSGKTLAYVFFFLNSVLYLITTRTTGS
jgi:ATP-dependent RNA helicase DDX10/DBP4